MNKIIIGVLGGVAVIALIIGSLALVGGNQSKLGNKTVSFWDAVGGFKVNGTAIVDSSRNATFVDGTFSGGDLTVTTTNNATSTVTLGCVQTYATSTATAIRWGMDLTATTTAKDQYGNTVGGFLSWGYGSCPF